ncbi:ABC transporter ATP-binding protein [Paenibacillus sp. R14(2021)]|uniref:ABC transporter ATP-binding protein n=1 Tax=Paenibacillus sp. R14(2021) TaxID=2859228 RepID=UPI001C6130D4|nr:ABC transporter ATP-binding protein [Paenibacillus sp. R14(2021)]
MSSDNVILNLKNLSVNYGAIRAVKTLDLTIRKGEIVSLFGTNGSGKTTTLRTISGIVRAADGEVIFQGRDISRLEPHRIVQLGISHVPEGRGVFPDLTVTENLRVGAYTRKESKYIKEDMKGFFELFPRLEERKNQLAGTMSGGEQQMLAIARALMAKPKLLLMDEPSMGLAPIIVKEIFKATKRINNEGVSVLLVEQNTQMALSVADRGYLMETGEVTVEGSADELKNNDMIRRVYLGIH